jgi:hypothetical protein
MATVDDRAVTRAQLLDMLDALDGVIRQRSRSDLAEFATAIEDSLPALIEQASTGAPVQRCCPPSSFRFLISRDSEGLIDEVVVRPMSQPQ